MKISKAQKEKNRRKIILAAVSLFEEKGFDKVTMKQIAKEADMADSTVYKYFANKEKFLFAFHELMLLNAIKACGKEKAYDGFDLQEKIQFFIDIYLDQLIEHREFVGDSLKILMSTPLSGFNRRFPARDELKELMTAALDQAIEREEMPNLPYREAITHLMTDAVLGVVLYWLKDDSEEFHQTTQMVDMSLSLLITLLKSGLINRVSELATFVIKSQMIRFIEDGSLISNLMNVRNLAKLGKGLSGMGEAGGRA